MYCVHTYIVIGTNICLCKQKQYIQIYSTVASVGGYSDYYWDSVPGTSFILSLSQSTGLTNFRVFTFESRYWNSPLTIFVLRIKCGVTGQCLDLRPHFCLCRIVHIAASGIHQVLN